jgi:hypothetical protein
MIRARIQQGRINALAPIERITKRLASQGICKIKNFSKQDVIPTRKTAWVNLSNIEIVQKYNKVWLGLLNYYSFAYNRSQMNFIQYLLLHSLACTLMNKLKLNSRCQVFKKFGGSITVGTIKDKPIQFRSKKFLKRINKFNNQQNKNNPFTIFSYAVRTYRSDDFDRECIICKSTTNVEMHHRRPLKATKTDNTLKGININLSRKQIPVCRRCRESIHAGTYDGPGIYGHRLKKSLNDSK